jgi:hypothetical protein
MYVAPRYFPIWIQNLWKYNHLLIIEYDNL